MNIHIKSIVSAIAFSLLFYSKSFGLNLVLISILVVVLTVSIKKGQRVPWGYTSTYILTAILVFLNPTGFTIFVHFMVFMVFVGKSISHKSALYITWLIGIVNMLIASVTNFVERTQNPKEKKKDVSPKTLNTIKGVLTAIVLLLVFTLLYKNANPVFENLIGAIDLSFISLPWILFTFLGYYLFLNVLRPLYPKELVDFDASQSNDLDRPEIPFSDSLNTKIDGEHTLGSIIFGALNLLLLFFLATDIIYLFQETDISNSEYSQSVHEGVYALMFSIVCAIALILYFFRGNLNFFEGNQRLKTLTYVWIGLNVALVICTSYKNYGYVETLGLTYKRIGVFVYLLLTLTGLVTAYIKVAQIKSFVYLVRTNIVTVFAFLVISAGIPWDKTITFYNLNTIENPDIDYLIGLGNSNSPQLYEYAKAAKKGLSIDIKESITEKHNAFLLEQYEKTWQEYTLYQLTNHTTK